MNKEQHLTYELGITNVPSDATCDDNGLEESMGMVYADGEHRVIQKPTEKMTLASGHTLLYIHKYNGAPRYITKATVNNVDTLFWHKSASDTVSLGVTNPVAVTAVGNTLVVNTTAGLNYLLWDGTQYKSIGTRVPDIPIKFSLYGGTNDKGIHTERYVTFPSDSLHGIIIKKNLTTEIAGSSVAQGHYEDFKTTLIGLVSMRLNDVKEAKRFAFPFWARYAIRLYDDTYTQISQPFLLMPSVRYNWDIFTCGDDGEPRSMPGNAGGWAAVNYKPYYAGLKYQIGNHALLDDWQDIIVGVDIFVSEEVKTFGMEDKWTIENCYNVPTDESQAGSSTPNIYFDGNHSFRDTCKPEYDNDKIPAVSLSDDSTWNTRFRPSFYSDDEIKKKLVDTSVFYKLFELNYDELSDTSEKTADNKISASTLKNLKTQKQLPNDDYFSRAPMRAEIIKTYNSRLHLANVTRGFFDGFNTFSYTAHYGVGAKYYYYVTIKANDGKRVVCSESSNNNQEIPDIWFYYPDPRAEQVDIFRSGVKIASMALKEHPSLNGAYAFIRLPEENETIHALTGNAPTVYNTDEVFEDHVFVSEANNPWVFNSKGDVTTNMGAIIGIATQTMSLGEQEHGIHPLTIFSERGISIFRLNNEGVYMRSDEISREVAYKDNPCITETDGPVYFASERGLMVLLGSQVKCVSEQLNGKSGSPFAIFLKNAFIAYDYRDSLLWIFDDSQNGSRYCWIYSIKSGTFARYDFGSNNIISNVVADYPDYLLQSGSKIFSLLERDNINEDTDDDYAATLITRAMKLGDGLTLKSIMRMRNIYELNDNGSLSVSIFAKNDLNSAWRELTHLRGTPWKYYQLRYSFSSLKATDRFAGTMLITQERYTNKPR